MLLTQISGDFILLCMPETGPRSHYGETNEVPETRKGYSNNGDFGKEVVGKVKRKIESFTGQSTRVLWDSLRGIDEALVLRDGGSDKPKKGVSKVVDNANTIIAHALVGKDPTQHTAIDNLMVQQLDGTINEWGWCKQKLGANVILALQG
ncbi:enolase-like [Glycine max]|uniref:enolase-like n=1 Tax=Glycine max TaxID=3847 RepID=UPI0007192E69|nr:enolase-like [Glycine max]|eukprot:XP_014624160.1 enolase-like [Glycine max]